MTTEKRFRSVLKALSWRVTGTIDTVIISFVITHKVQMALSIGFIELFTKMALYYCHERVWNRLKFGRIETPPDYQI